MNCFNRTGAEEAKEVTLVFKRDQLLYDIENCTFIEGSVMETESAHVRHMVQDIGQDGNVDKATRVLDLAVAYCREMLYPYTKHDVHRDVVDNQLRERDSYGIVMRVPSGYSQTTINYLSKLIHEYLVDQVVCEWMSMTYPGKTAIWVAKASDMERRILTSLNTRRGRVRRTLNPF